MGSLPPSPAPLFRPAPAYNSPILAQARLCGRRGAPALLERPTGALPTRLPLLPPRRRPAAQTKETLPLSPLPHWGPSAGDGHCVSPEAREGTRGGDSLAWRRFKCQVGGRCGEPRTKGGRETQVMGRQPDAEGAAEQMRKRRDRRQRGWLCAPPPGAQRTDPSSCHPGEPQLPCHLCISRAPWGPEGRSCLCADPGRGGGPSK